MNIQSLNFQHPNTQFKSAFPVVHWVAETNGSYAPETNLKIVKKLQGKIIRMLNKPLSESTKPMNPVEQRFRAYIGSCDVAYRLKSLVRSFYNIITGSPRHFVPTAYVISGEDVGIFEDLFAKDIGRAKGRGIATQETNDALNVYHRRGLDFVKDGSKQIKDENGVPYILHTKFEVVRNKFNKIKDYRFIDARFLPAKGPKNPLKNI